MRTPFPLGVVAITAALAVMPAGAAAAQTADSPARSASTSAPAALVGPERISLTRLHLVSGVVRDRTGRALGGVCVRVTGAGGLLRMTRTSANGRYVMSLPRAGTYSVQYRSCKPGKAAVPAFAAPLARQIEVGASPVTAVPAVTLRLASQSGTTNAIEAAGIAVPRQGRIVRPRAGAASVALEPRASGLPNVRGLTGRVRSPAGKPLAGICVWVVGKSFAVGTETTRRGTYKFGPGLDPGRYPVLFASRCGDASNPFVPIAPGRWAPEWYKGKFAQAKADKVRLRAHRVTRGINAVMQHAGEISGAVSGSDHHQLKNACAVVTNSSGQELGQAITNAKGGYTITGLDPGSYRLVAIAACTGGVSDYGQVWYLHAASVKKAQVIKVRLGRRTSGINVVLPKLGTITGFVRLGGKTGKPLGGMCVGVFSPTNFDAGGFARSEKSGKYVVEGLPAGRYQVEANVGGCGNKGNYAPASFPRAVHVADARTTSGINLYMQPGGTLTGTVTDASTAKPLAGICISDDDGDFAVTGKDGTYKIEQLPAERTTVEFDGGCGNAGSYAPQFYGGEVTQEAAPQVTVTAGHVTAGIDAAMLPGATLAGRVTNPAGRPVRGVCIGILPTDETGFGLFGGDTWTKSSGAYLEANLAPGGYAVAYFSGCLGPSNAAVLQWFKGQATEATAGIVDASAGTKVAGIDAVVGRGGAIAGSVTSTTGQAIQFDCVTAVNRRTGQPGGFQSLSGAGIYTISSLAPGSYTVVGTDCDGGSNLAQKVYQHPVTVRAGSTTRKVALRLARGGAVTGRITAASNGRAVPNACVEATPVSVAAAKLGIGSFAFTGRSGRYKMVGLRAGRYRIEIFPSCFGPAMNLHPVTLRYSVQLAQGQVKAGVNAVLRAGGSIAGLVTATDAAAVPGACVEAFQIPGGVAGETSTDAHGQYGFTGLTPGRYKVEFGDPTCSDDAAGLGTQWYHGAAGSGSATVISVAADQTVSAINAVLPADGTITGSVTGTSTSPLSGVCVSAVPLAKGEPHVFTVSAGGEYTLADLPTGRYRVEFQSGCGQASVTTQWWQNAASRAAAKIITVSASATVSGIDAVLTGG